MDENLGDFNAFNNLGNRYRSGDFNAPRNSIFFETETFKVIFKDSGTEVIFFVSISSSSIVRLTNDIHDHVSIVNIICSRVWFFDHIFLELVGNLTLLTKYLIEERDDHAMDNNYCSKVFL